MFKHFLTFLLLAAMTSASAGEMTLLEEATEFERLNARVTADGKGYVQLKRCDECELVRLTIDSRTQLVVNGKRRALGELNNGELRFGTAFYDAESLRVTRINGSR